MRNVKIKVLELMSRVVENRTNHQTIFERALEGYRKEVIKELEISLSDAKTGRKEAVDALGKLGNKSVLPELLNVLKDQDYDVRASAALAIFSLSL